MSAMWTGLRAGGRDCGMHDQRAEETPTLSAGSRTASISASGGDRTRGLYETVQSLELSVRLATALYQPVDTIGDCDERKSRANDRSWSTMDPATLPTGGRATEVRRTIIDHIAGSCDT